MSTQPMIHIHNFRTGDTDYIEGFPSDWSDYIPQIPVAQNLYQLYIELGKSPADAAKEVLTICVGGKKP